MLWCAPAVETAGSHTVTRSLVVEHLASRRCAMVHPTMVAGTTWRGGFHLASNICMPTRRWKQPGVLEISCWHHVFESLDKEDARDIASVQDPEAGRARARLCPACFAYAAAQSAAPQRTLNAPMECRGCQAWDARSVAWPSCSVCCGQQCFHSWHAQLPSTAGQATGQHRWQHWSSHGWPAKCAVHDCGLCV